LRTGDFVCAAGVVLDFAAESDANPANVDHFWITIDAGLGDGLQIAISTASRKNQEAGFDPRMRVAVVASVWASRPAAGVAKLKGFDYAEVEAGGECRYQLYERPALEDRLAEKSGRAIFVEAWGEFYLRAHLGIHQVHSRRASCSVTQDLVGRDGAIRFYFPDNTSEMLLFKFCGQV
jgi:hypothetical protein